VRQAARWALHFRLPLAQLGLDSLFRRPVFSFGHSASSELALRASVFCLPRRQSADGQSITLKRRRPLERGALTRRRRELANLAALKLAVELDRAEWGRLECINLIARHLGRPFGAEWAKFEFGWTSGGPKLSWLITSVACATH